jgi:hypothetical protein
MERTWDCERLWMHSDSDLLEIMLTLTSLVSMDDVQQRMARIHDKRGHNDDRVDATIITVATPKQRQVDAAEAWFFFESVSLGIRIGAPKAYSTMMVVAER